MLKYENSPYLELNGLYEPDTTEQQDGVSDTCDGVIPFPFIQPELTANGTDVAVAWAAASYISGDGASGKNKNQLFGLFPEEELYQCRKRIDGGNLPAGWGTQGLVAQGIRNVFYEHLEMNTIFEDAIV